MSITKCMTYQGRQEWLRAVPWQIAGDLMRLHEIDRVGLVPELQKAIEKAVKTREAQL